MESPSRQTNLAPPTPTTGRLLVFLGALVHVVFTLLPDSSSWAVLFPWILIWQLGLFAFVVVALLLLARRSPFFLLGSELDWGVGLFFTALCISTIFSQFPQHGLWYSLVCFSFIAIAYVLNNHLNHPDRVDRLLRMLRFQAWLGLLLVIESLGLWIFTTLKPELERLEALRGAGVNLTYDFSDIQLRNWAPFGHQNYTAGFLILALPLFVAMAIILAKQKWLWISAIALSLVTLYTTSSRGGFLALVLLVIYAIAILLFRRVIPRTQALIGGLGAFALITVAVIFNNRLQSLVLNLFSGGSELAFRQVTIETGWRMGLDRWLTGAGAGSAFLLFQQYRPTWGAKISEWIFQLHNTPIQIWAELGILGSLALLWIAIFTVNLFIRLHFSPTWRSHYQHQVFTYSSFGALLVYAIFSLTDFQLDVFGISTMLLIIWLSLVHIGQVHLGRAILPFSKLRQTLALVLTGGAIAALVWLVPVNRAWQLSNIGFRALSANQTQVFETNLTEAYNLAPWEPYYSLQLGFNMADYARQTKNSKLLERELGWLEKGIKANPYQEFGYSAAAWINIQKQNPTTAERQFRRALELAPSRREIPFGLAVSLLQQQKTDEGLTIIAQEFSKYPSFATSPLWDVPQWQKLYPQILAKMPGKKTPILNWWLSKTEAETNQAIATLATQGGKFKILAEVLQNKPSQSQEPATPLTLAINAWNNPTQRQPLLTRAWAIATQNLPDQNSKLIVEFLVKRMETAKTFDRWLRDPVRADSPLLLRSSSFRQGFSVNSRHIDGGVPRDFWELQSHALVFGFLSDLF
jgi:tetratricopeptide (TPR) repeat protein